MMQGCYINYPGSIVVTSIFRDVHGPGPKVPVSQGFRSSASNGVDTIGKSAKKLWGLQSSLFCFMDFMWRYHGSKGVPESIVEDGVLGNLAPPGDLEESASHHDPPT